MTPNFFPNLAPVELYKIVNYNNYYYDGWLNINYPLPFAPLYDEALDKQLWENPGGQSFYIRDPERYTNAPSFGKINYRQNTDGPKIYSDQPWQPPTDPVTGECPSVMSIALCWMPIDPFSFSQIYWQVSTWEYTRSSIPSGYTNTTPMAGTKWWIESFNIDNQQQNAPRIVSKYVNLGTYSTNQINSGSAISDFASIGAIPYTLKASQTGQFDESTDPQSIANLSRTWNKQFTAKATDIYGYLTYSNLLNSDFSLESMAQSAIQWANKNTTNNPNSRSKLDLAQKGVFANQFQAALSPMFEINKERAIPINYSSRNIFSWLDCHGIAWNQNPNEGLKLGLKLNRRLSPFHLTLNDYGSILGKVYSVFYQDNRNGVVPGANFRWVPNDFFYKTENFDAVSQSYKIAFDSFIPTILSTNKSQAFSQFPDSMTYSISCLQDFIFKGDENFFDTWNVDGNLEVAVDIPWMSYEDKITIYETGKDPVSRTEYTQSNITGCEWVDGMDPVFNFWRQLNTSGLRITIKRNELGFYEMFKFEDVFEGNEYWIPHGSKREVFSGGSKVTLRRPYPWPTQQNPNQWPAGIDYIANQLCGWWNAILARILYPEEGSNDGVCGSISFKYESDVLIARSDLYGMPELGFTNIVWKIRDRFLH